MSAEYPDRNVATLMGARRKQTLPDAPEPETGNAALDSAWEIYNKRATLFDKEMIKDWNDSLNTLLVFAALYSAVLTAFIIESMKLLEENPNEISRDILLVMTQQFADSSVPPYQKPPFVVPAFALRVNAYFLISIASSLIAALGSVLALQWVGSYDFGLNTSSPKERALQRQFRNTGVLRWKMPEIIAFLPILLFVALFLFLVGLVDWVFHIHRGLAGIVMLGAVIAALFYITTTLLSVRYLDAPFRTPVSKSLIAASRGLLNLLQRILRAITQQDGTFIPSNGPQNFAKLEEKVIKSTPLLALDSLLWAINSVDATLHSRTVFMILVKELLQLPNEHLMNGRIENMQWSPIFEILCQPYLGREVREEYTTNEVQSDEMKFLARSIGLIGTQRLSETVEKFAASLTKSSGPQPIDDIATYGSFILLLRGSNNKPETFKFIDSMLLNIQHLSHQTVYRCLFLIQQMKIEHRLGNVNIPVAVAERCSIRSGNHLGAVALAPEVLDSLIRLLTIDISPEAFTRGSALDNYLLVYQEAQNARRFDPYHNDALKAIHSQYYTRLIQAIHTNARPQIMQHLIQSIQNILVFTRSTVIWSDLVRVMSNRTIVDTVLRPNGINAIRCIGLVFEIPSSNSTWDIDQSESLRLILLGCDRMLEQNLNDIVKRGLIQLLLCALDIVCMLDSRRGIRAMRRLISNPPLKNPAVVLASQPFRIQSRIKKLEVVTSGPPAYRFPDEAWVDRNFQIVTLWYFNFLQTFENYGDRSELRFDSEFVWVVRTALMKAPEHVRYHCVAMIAKLNDIHDFPHLSIFRPEALRGVLSVSTGMSSQYQLTILSRLTKSHWFHPVFVAVGGFLWIEDRMKNSKNTGVLISTICNGIETAPPSLLLYWTLALRECLCHAAPIGSIARRTVSKMFTDESTKLREILQLQTQTRERIQYPASQRMATSKVNHMPVAGWPPSEWNQWVGLMEDVIHGLEGGFISDYQPRHLRDPDGYCHRVMEEQGVILIPLLAEETIDPSHHPGNTQTKTRTMDIG